MPEECTATSLGFDTYTQNKKLPEFSRQLWGNPSHPIPSSFLFLCRFRFTDRLSFRFYMLFFFLEHSLHLVKMLGHLVFPEVHNRSCQGIPRKNGPVIQIKTHELPPMVGVEIWLKCMPKPPKTTYNRACEM